MTAVLCSGAGALRRAGAAAFSLLALTLPAVAGSLGGNSGLVRGGAPLPQFTSSLPLQIGDPDPIGAANHDLEISLTQPDHSVLSFLFSPRGLVGQAPNIGVTPGASFAGLAWNIFDNDRLFGTFALTGGFTHPFDNDPTRKLYGPLISLHSTFELGYSIDPGQSLSFDVDRAEPAPVAGDRFSFGSSGENLRLQYGYHF